LRPMSRCVGIEPLLLAVDSRAALRAATLDRTPISGLTHRFYRYPARFSPRFARTVIELFSTAGDLVLDPYMGGGTTVVEAMASGRNVVGNDINSLGVFVARVKTTPLSSGDRESLIDWCDNVIPRLSYALTPDDLADVSRDRRTHNLTLPRTRALKKVLALALRSVTDLPSDKGQEFARCSLLNAAQLFLNGGKRSATVEKFREHLRATVKGMLNDLADFEATTVSNVERFLTTASASELSIHEPFRTGRKADMVVTSPPYPGIHMLYHRWQVDGRRETPAPYWLSNCRDGQGNAYYNFADRRASAEKDYFAESLRTLQGVRAVVREGAVMAQLVAFGNPRRHLPKYLLNMEAAGFRELRLEGRRRIWRDVPSRRWHATLKGRLNASREVLLLHEAI
jgi:hypothetical protein